MLLTADDLLKEGNLPIISAQACFAFARFLHAMITLAPRLANSLAVSFPIPVLAPVKNVSITRGFQKCKVV